MPGQSGTAVSQTVTRYVCFERQKLAFGRLGQMGHTVPFFLFRLFTRMYSQLLFDTSSQKMLPGYKVWLSAGIRMALYFVPVSTTLTATTMTKKNTVKN